MKNTKGEEEKEIKKDNQFNDNKNLSVLGEIELKKTLKGQVENQLNSNDTQNLIDVY